MPQDQESIWSKEFKNIPPTADTILEGAINLSEYIDARVTSKLSLSSSGFALSPDAVYSWIPPVFANLVAQLVPSIDPIIPATILANAWATVAPLATMLISAGASTAPPAGGNGIFGPPPLVLANAASIAVAQAALLSDLINIDPAAKELEMPKAFRKAFAALRYDITGIDTTTPTPIPIIVIAQKVV